MNAFIFPGQGAQFPGMAKELYATNPIASQLFDSANQILGFRITDIMFNGTDDQLKQTNVAQPAIFLHSVILALTLDPNLQPNMVAGHSLGEFSALVVSKVLSFEDGLRLVAQRANAMQKACELTPSTMAAVLGLTDEQVENVCRNILDDTVVCANYNCPGQIVISGTEAGVDKACQQLLAIGAKRALKLKVGGAFHSPLMEPARIELSEAIGRTNFHKPSCPVYQNVDALPTVEPQKIRENLVRQLTQPVRWTHMVQNMVKDGTKKFTEIGPGNVLQNLVRKIEADVIINGLS
jgi:[acyl-carrier-protein] S-malonyltransferase